MRSRLSLIYIVIIAFTSILLLCSQSIVIKAGSPTATPTLRPIPASPTSASLFLHPTPTPLNIVLPVNPGFHFDVNGNSFADQVINIYRAINFNHAIDLVLSIVVVFLVVRFMVMNIGDTTDISGK